MNIKFYKYQGAGNDFIIVDNRAGFFSTGNHELVQRLCDRRFGIGADGLMLLQNKAGYDFEMVYFNADGRESSMCGNGGRCIVAFAQMLNIFQSTDTRFFAIDGSHDAIVLHSNNETTSIRLKMLDVTAIEKGSDFVFLNTGSPHYVIFSDNLKQQDVVAEGRKIRYSKRFEKEGTNVNFVEKQGHGIFVRTYERGVEDETLSCGTGVTASALAAHYSGLIPVAANECEITSLGGDLKVYFRKTAVGYENVWLEGPATFVFKGNIDI